MRRQIVAVALAVAAQVGASACENRNPSLPTSPEAPALTAPAGDISTTPRTTATANNSEQLVFSGVATEGTGAPVGFWIWCEVESNNPYEDECNGSMYFYALGITKHVEDVEDGITESAGESYQIKVHSTKDDSIACTLENAPNPVHGPRNTVTVMCTSPQNVNAVSHSAVVNVTGPGD